MNTRKKFIAETLQFQQSHEEICGGDDPVQSVRNALDGEYYTLAALEAMDDDDLEEAWLHARTLVEM